MSLEPRLLHNISHPFIDSIYLKKEFDGDRLKKGKDVLVIDAKRGNNSDERDQFLSFLADLDLIKDEVERKVGKFKRIDIRYH